MLRLVESFTSIQGESTHAGRVCHFLRLAGCNLDCNYCDTRYARYPEAGQPTTVEALVTLAKNSGIDLVEITGGEPLLNPETPELCQKLLDAGFEVMIETNGAVSIAALPCEVCKILDCKLPGSGMADHNLESNYALLQPHDEVKFVVSSRADFDYAREIIRKHNLAAYTKNLLASPVWSRVSFDQLAEWVVAARGPLRMQLQLHKQIWGDKPGV